MPTTPSFNSPIGLCRDRWILENDSVCHKLNQVVTPTAAAVSGVDLLLEQINISPVTHYVAINLASAFFSPVHKDHQKHFACIWKGQKHAFIPQPKGCMDPVALSYHSVHRGLDHFSLPQEIALVHTLMTDQT